MKTKKGFRLRELGGDYILIGESVELVNFNNLITFNEAAAYLWQQVEYVLGGGSSHYMFLVLATMDLLNK